ncbi:MAG: sensor histidine kinase, partial [Chloroflexota bacterium]
GPEDSGLLVALARQAAPAVIRTGQAEALRARAEDAEGLARAGAALAGILDPDLVIEAVLDQATALFSPDFGAVLLCEGDWARIAAGRGAAPLPIGTHVIDMRGSGGAVLGNGTTIYVSDVAVDPVWRDFPLWSGEQRIRALLLAPLLIEGVLQGVLCLGSFQPRAYDARRRGLIGALAERGSGALRMARLFKSERLPAATANLLPASAAPVEALDWVPEPPRPPANPAADPAQSKHVLENLRVLALMDVGMLRPASEPTNIGSLTRMAAAQDETSQAGLILTGPDDVTALADPSYAALVLENLLDNARKYSAEGALIHITWAVEDRMAVVRVIDQGRGIPPGGRRRLFARFGWTPAEGAGPGPHGVGLSLYLGRALAEAMDGALELETTSRTGSTFRLSLPVLPD